MLNGKAFNVHLEMREENEELGSEIEMQYGFIILQGTEQFGIYILTLERITIIRPVS